MIGLLDGPILSDPAVPLLLKSPIIQGIAVGHRRALEDLVDAIDRTGLKPVIDHCYDFASLPAALDMLEEGPFGKVDVSVFG